MINFCYIFTFIFEQFVSYMFFSKKFEIKTGNKIILLFLSISFSIQNIVSITEIPYLNLITFFICNFFFLTFCFEATIKQTIFNLIILESFMVTTELFVIYTVSMIFNFDLTEFANSESIMALETAASKTLYFLLAYATSKASQKRHSKKGRQDFSFVLFILPLVSILVIVSFVYLSIQENVTTSVYYLFLFISFMLLLSNIVIFLVHEKIVKTLIQNANLQLEAQRNEINKDYYSDLEKQYETSNILIHDIKKHLGMIRSLLRENNYDEIDRYIDSVYESRDIQALKIFSETKLVNVILNRYFNLCRDENIHFNADVRNVDLSFIQDGDITTVLGNLLENAYNAAKQSTGRFIEITIDITNECYILIEIKNSCNTKPETVNDSYFSYQKEKGFHGFGTKSVKKVAKKYDGTVSSGYIEESKEFFTLVLLKN